VIRNRMAVLHRNRSSVIEKKMSLEYVLGSRFTVNVAGDL